MFEYLLCNSCDNPPIHVVIGKIELSFDPSISDEMMCKIIRAVRYCLEMPIQSSSLVSILSVDVLIYVLALTALLP